MRLTLLLFSVLAAGCQPTVDGVRVSVDASPVAASHAAPMAGGRVVCAQPGEAGFLMLHARPLDGEWMPGGAAELRSALNGSAALVMQSALLADYSAALKVRCDGDGAPGVTRVQLNMTGSEVEFDRVLADLALMGYADASTKYAVLLESENSVGGEAWRYDDTRPGQENLNNHGPTYALFWGGVPWHLFLHEVGHMLGAVQHDAPHSTGNSHCNDGQDVMCYRDDGPTSSFRSVCVDGVRFDCNHDTYFNPRPALGSYLATHWNLANSRWLLLNPVQGDSIVAPVLVEGWP